MKKLLLLTILLMSTIWSFAQDLSPLPSITVKKLIAPNSPTFYYDTLDSALWIFKGETGWFRIAKHSDIKFKHVKNGLYADGDTAKLGGVLTENTVIGMNDKTLEFLGSGDNQGIYIELNPLDEMGNNNLYMNPETFGVETYGNGHYTNFGTPTSEAFVVFSDTLENTGHNSLFIVKPTNIIKEVKTPNNGTKIIQDSTKIKVKFKEVGSIYLPNGSIQDYTGIRYTGIDSTLFQDSTLVPKYYVKKLISDVVPDSIDVSLLATKAQVGDSIAQVRSEIPDVSGYKLNSDSTAATGYTRRDRLASELAKKITKVTLTDNAIVRADGTSGSVQNSGVTIDDSNNLNIPTGSTYRINNVQVSSANLSNDANLAKLDATQTFTGVNSFHGRVGFTAQTTQNADVINSSGLQIASLFNVNPVSGAGSQLGSIFASVTTKSGESTLNELDGILTSLYHYFPYNIPKWKGIETGAAVVDGIGASITDCWGIECKFPLVTNGGAVTNAAAIHIPSLSGSGITNAYAILSEAAYPSVFTGRLEFKNSTGNNNKFESSSNVFLLRYAPSGMQIRDNNDNVIQKFISGQTTIGSTSDNNSFTVPPLVLGAYNQVSGGSAYGNYGGLVFSSNSSYTSGARRWLITNALGGNKFAIIRSTNATTDPTIVSSAITSGTANFVIDNTGNIGINGITSPTSYLHLPAGTATAGTAPLGFTSGALLTTPVVGKVEFLNDAWYGTITTGAARKTFAFLENFAIGTSGTAPNLSGYTINIPMASTASVTAGLISKTQYDTFNAKLSAEVDGIIGNEDDSIYFTNTGLWYANGDTATIDIGGVGTYEPVLGNPAVNNYILQSTVAGVRSWVEKPLGMVYPEAGIAVASGIGSWSTSIPDNSANWNAAYGWGDHSGLYTPISHDGQVFVNLGEGGGYGVMDADYFWLSDGTVKPFLSLSPNIGVTHPITSGGVYTALLGKQDTLSGDGFVKASGTNITYDNSTYNTGSGTSGRVTYWNGTNSLTSDADFTFDGIDLRVGATNGTGVVYSGNFSATSDRRLKKNIHHITGLNWVRDIDFKEFSMKADSTNRRRYGVIAQNLEKIAPELVYTENDSLKTKSVAYTDMLIAIVADLTERVTILEMQVKKLNKKSKRHEK